MLPGEITASVFLPVYVKYTLHLCLFAIEMIHTHSVHVHVLPTTVARQEDDT
jgi:hypothetical protein